MFHVRKLSFSPLPPLISASPAARTCRCLGLARSHVSSSSPPPLTPSVFLPLSLPFSFATDFMFAALGARPILSAAGVPGAPALASAAHLHSHQGGPYPRRHSLPGGLAAPSQLSELAAFPEDTEMVRTHRLEDMLFSGVASGGARPPRPHLPQHQLQHPGHAQQQFLRAMGAEPGAGAGGATLQYPGAARGGGGGGGSAGAHRASAPVGQMHMQPFTAAAGDETVAQRQLFENVFSALF